jgi:hypothetical protein
MFDGFAQARADGSTSTAAAKYKLADPWVKVLENDNWITKLRMKSQC